MAEIENELESDAKETLEALEVPIVVYSCEQCDK